MEYQRGEWREGGQRLTLGWIYGWSSKVAEDNKFDLVINGSGNGGF